MMAEYDEKILARRNFLKAWAVGAAAASITMPFRGAIAATPKFINYPFSLGIACGDPTPEGFVCWTRIAPNPLDPSYFMPDGIEVVCEIAEDEGFKKIIRRQTEIAHPDTAHTIHAEIIGLRPQRQYFYRFIVGGIVSDIGRAATTTPIGSNLAKMRFAWHSCSHYEQGLFTAFRDMAKQNPDVILALGDYIYEVSYGAQFRRYPVNEAFSLDDYRMNYAVTKMDKDLQEAHKACPWLFIWDDHEIANDYQGLVGKPPFGMSPDVFPQRRRNGYQAFFEHIPLRARSRLNAINNMRIYGQNYYGNLLEFTLLDARQFRDRAACSPEGRFEATTVSRSACTELTDQSRTILGSVQERFVNENFMHAGCKWSVLVQPTLFSTLFQKDSKGDDVAYNEGWSSFEPARQKLINMMAQRNDKSSPVVIGGDMHAFWAAEVKKDYSKPDSETVAVEFVGGSITSKSYNYKRFMAMLPDNPHIKFFDDRTNGYGLVDVNEKEMTVKLRHTASTWDDGGVFNNIKQFVVERGRNQLNEI